MNSVSLHARAKLFWHNGKCVKGSVKRTLGMELEIVQASSADTNMMTPMARD